MPYILYANINELAKELKLLKNTFEQLTSSLIALHKKDPLEPLYALLVMDDNTLIPINMKWFADLLLATNYSEVNIARLQQFAREFPEKSELSGKKSRQLIFELMKAKPINFKNIGKISALPDIVSAIAVDPKTDDLIAAGDYKGNIYLIDPHNMSIIQTLTLGSYGIRAISFSPTETVLAMGDVNHSNNLIIVSYDILAKKFEHKTINAHSDSVTGIAFSHTGTLLASTSDDGSVKLWNTVTWELEKTLLGHHGYGLTVSFNADDSLLASGCMDGTVKIWNVKTGVLVTTLIKEDIPERTVFDSSYDTSIAGFHPTKRELLAVVLHGEKELRFYDCNHKKYIMTLPSVAIFPNALSFNKTGELLAIRNYGGGIVIIEVNTFKQIGMLSGLDSESLHFTSVCFNADNEIITSYDFGVGGQGQGALLFFKQYNIPGDYPTALAMFIAHTIESMK